MGTVRDSVDILVPRAGVEHKALRCRPLEEEGNRRPLPAIMEVPTPLHVEVNVGPRGEASHADEADDLPVGQQT